MQLFKRLVTRCGRSITALLIRAGRRCVDSRRLQAAYLLYRCASDLRPSARLLTRLSALAMDLNWYRIALICARKAIATSGLHALHHVQLGLVYARMGYYRSARECADFALTLNPGDARPHMLLAMLSREEGNSTGAIEYATTALTFARSRGRAAQVHWHLAQLQADQARREDMVQSCIHSLKLQRDHVPSYFSLADTGYYKNALDEDVEAMERLTAARGVSRKDKQHLHFALGKIYDGCGDSDRAFRHFQRGNKLRRLRAGYSSRTDVKGTSRRIQIFTRERLSTLASAGSTSDSVIFIIGMPRSGTTLIEQMLDTHSLVTGLGERTDIVAALQQLEARLAWTGLPYPECVEYLNTDLIHDLSAKILAAFMADADGATRVVTKRPDDFSELGLIHILFPRAKIIHCRRHPLDTCLSCFMHDFAHIQYSTSLPNLRTHYQQYRRLMGHWRDALPQGAMLDIDYERLVSEPSACVDQLLSFCDLRAEAISDSFFVNRRRVDTASAWQVRRPIYTDSVGRWRRYERHLGSLRKLMQSVYTQPDRHCDGEAPRDEHGLVPLQLTPAVNTNANPHCERASLVCRNEPGPERTGLMP